MGIHRDVRSGSIAGGAPRRLLRAWGAALLAAVIACGLLVAEPPAPSAAWAGTSSIVENQGGVIGAGWPTASGDALDGSGQLIVVIDGAFNPTHPMLRGRVVEEACFSKYKEVHSHEETLCSTRSGPWALDDKVRFESGPGTSRYDTSCIADDGRVCEVFHGTAAASAAAGNRVEVGGSVGTVSGIAPGASLALLKVGKRAGWGDSTEAVEAALRYVRDVLSKRHRIAAVNVSNSYSVRPVPDGAPCPTSHFSSLTSELTRLGIPVVIAAGNDGYTDATGWWSCVPDGVAVGSANVSDPNTLVGGPLGTNASARVKMLAPVGDGSDGNGVWVAWAHRTATSGAAYENRYNQLIGTSFAAPQIAGAFAVLRQRLPSASVTELTGLLQRTGVNVVDERPGSTGVVTPRAWLAAAAGERGDRPVWDYSGDGRTDVPLIAGDRRTLLLASVREATGTVDTSALLTLSRAWGDRGITVPVWDYAAASTNGFIASETVGGRTELRHYPYDAATRQLGAGTTVASDVGSDLVGGAFVSGLPTVGTGTGLILQRRSGALELRQRVDRSTALGAPLPVLPAAASANSTLVAVADLDRDGRPDLVVRDATSGRPRAHFGTGIAGAPFAATGTVLISTSYWSGRQQGAVVDDWARVDGELAPWAWYSVRPVNGNQVAFPVARSGRIDESRPVLAATWAPGVRLLHAARAD